MAGIRCGDSAAYFLSPMAAGGGTMAGRHSALPDGMIAGVHKPMPMEKSIE